MKRDYLENGSMLFTITMRDQPNENRFTLEFLKQFSEQLDLIEQEVKRKGGGAALITTAEPHSKFFSNGIDLHYTATHPDDVAELMSVSLKLISRILLLPIPTFAVVNGHCFAGGLMLAMAHDYRLMREDRGWLCLPALDLGMQLPLAFYELLKTKLPTPAVLREVSSIPYHIIFLRIS